jgi:hypothetical protein
VGYNVLVSRDCFRRVNDSWVIHERIKIRNNYGRGIVSEQRYRITCWFSEATSQRAPLGEYPYGT